MIKDGKCVACEKKAKVIVTTETDKEIFGLCEVCYSGIDDLTASNLTNAFGIGNS